MRPRGTKSQAKGGCAVLLTAVLAFLAACASGQGGDVAAVSATPKLSAAAPKLSDSKNIKPPSVKRTAVRSKGGKRPAKATEVATDDAHIRALAAKAAPDDPAEQERLIREFKSWSNSRSKHQ